MEKKEKTEEANESNTWSDCSVIIPIRNEMTIDYTGVFTTKEIFESRDHLITWARNMAEEHGMMVVIKRSDNGGGRKRSRLYLSCERSGQYRKLKSTLFLGSVDNADEVENKENTKKRRKSGSKKCGCPFLLRGREISADEWALQVECGVHNHPTTHLITNPRTARSSSSSSTAAEEEFVINMPNKIQPNESQIHCLVSKLQEHRYIYHLRRCKETDTIKDIFYAHPTGVDLLRAFPRVLLMDRAYKTNEKCRYLLVEIVGVTSTGMTFQVACVYADSEGEEFYVWACTILKSLMNQSCLPSVIVTDQDIGLMNAARNSFPNSRLLLCRWHISRSMMANCRRMFRTNEKWESFSASWDLLVYADTEAAFYELLRRFQGDFAEYPGAVEYAVKEWIQPYKERFVSAWINDVMHFNNTTTNRAESHHMLLKKQLGSSMGNFDTCWAKIHSLLETSYNAIKSSFVTSICAVQNRYRSNVFKSLQGSVSIEALSKICDEMRGIPGKGIDHLTCRCVLRKTCGLPCAHELVEFVQQDKPIPLDVVDGFWMKLNMEPDVGVNALQKTCGSPCAHKLVEFVQEDKPIPLHMGDGFWRKLNMELDFGVSVCSRWIEEMGNLNCVFGRAVEPDKVVMLKRLMEIGKEFRK